ncbi:MAG: amidohydrolase [Dehalococcoidales bacterium]|nr:amidohydrolase [Dehalococcoidales bacterium]
MPTAELILKNANVITLDPGQPCAGLVAVQDDKIVLVTASDRLESLRGAGTKVIDCQGKTVVPGFNDAHCHIFSFLRKLLSIDLSPSSISSISDIKAVISGKAQQTPHDQWLIGTDYNDFYLAEKRHPTRWEIDEVAPYHPVVLSHRSLHACVLNSRALSLAGINRETPEPPGGLIDRDPSSGEPTGILFEMVGYIREKVMPSLSEAELTSGITLANRHYLSQGLTSLQDATFVNDFKRWQKFHHFKDTDKLKSRLYMMTGIEALSQFQEAGLAFGSGDSQLRLGGVKMILSEASGQLYPPQPQLNEQVSRVHRAGFQLAFHAVQPSTVEAAIVALESAQSQLPQAGRRHRIEHCSECPPHLLERLIKLQSMVVTQPPFLYYSGERYLARVPADRQPWLYRFRSFLDSGLTVAASSDSPLVPDNPLVGICAAITRQAASGQYVRPEEVISAGQALAMYTLNAACASFEEGIKGSITEGKLADMVLLSDDPTQVPPEQIKDIKVEMTIIGGKVVWEA